MFLLLLTINLTQWLFLRYRKDNPAGYFYGTYCRACAYGKYVRELRKQSTMAIFTVP